LVEPGEKNEEYEYEPDGLIIYSINESNLKECPHVKLLIGYKEVTAIVDSGAEISVLSENLFDELVACDMQVLILLVINGILISAWGSRTKRIRKQALIRFKMGSSSYEQVFMIAGQLMSDAILGANFLNELQAVMDLKNTCLVTNVNGVASSHNFVRESTGLAPGSNPINKVHCTRGTTTMEPCGADPMTRIKFAGNHEPEFSDS
jgi:hypothetical protein